jgi:hypothetical protein
MLTSSQQRDLDVAALAAAGVVALQTAAVFGARFMKTPVPMHFTGCMAGLVGLAYSVFRMCYWFLGATNHLDCSTLLIAGGVLQNTSIGLALLHLLLRAEAVNRTNKNWKKWRWLGITATVINAAAFVMYLLLRQVTQFRGDDGLQRCAFILNTTGLRVKFIVQALNHVTQTGLFVYPLIKHIRAMNKSITEGKEWYYPGLSMYRNLAARATVGMITATTFTAAVTVCVLFYNSNLEIRSVITVLSIVDMTMTLASITYAIDTKLQYDDTSRRSSIAPLVMRRRSSSSCCSNEAATPAAAAAQETAEGSEC